MRCTRVGKLCPMTANLTVQSVIKASAQFWEQMLAMHLEPITCGTGSGASGGEVCGSVNLTGVWTGRVEIYIGAGLAQLATATMLLQPADSVREADILDATKEIANMIAGVIKSSLPRPCLMDVPTACLRAVECCLRPTGTDALEVAFRHVAGDMLVRVSGSADAGAESTSAMT